MSDWFLPRSERPWTAGNLVVPHVHGANYFARLVEVIGATERGDRIYFTDWRGDPDERLTEEGPTIADLLTSAGRRGVEVRALLWRSHRGGLNAKENTHLGAVINDAGGEALLDERVRRGGSHHQKLVVVRRQGRPHEDVAFVGGIDLCHGRRDDAVHAGDPQAPPLDGRYGPTPPWHDAMAEIRGPAVADVLDTFAERWDDPTPLDHRNPYRAAVHRAAGMPRHPKPLPEAVGPAPGSRPTPGADPAHLPGQAARVPLRPEGGAVHRPRLHARLRPRSPADLHRGPVLLVRRGGRRAGRGPTTRAGAAGDRRGPPLPREGRPRRAGRPRSTANGLPGRSCARPAATGSRSSTSSAQRDRRSTCTPRCAWSTTSG